MKLTGHRKVHNAPIGYEIDRIDLAVKQIGADRVYLIKDPEESKGHPFPERPHSQDNQADSLRIAQNTRMPNMGSPENHVPAMRTCAP